MTSNPYNGRFRLGTKLLEPIAASFRDPDGYLFKRDDQVLRMVNESYFEDYDLLMGSGLYAELVDRGWLLAHEELPLADDAEGGRILKPEQLKYVSYPYEWSFSQLKDAALLTLNIQLLALKHGMTLKDASAYNVQLHEGRPCFIDTLSFERYTEGQPWSAYRQYCQHFLAPLVLTARKDYRLTHLLKSYIDGIPLDLASKLLPKGSWMNFGILAHIHLHAMSQIRFADDARSSDSVQKVEMSKSRLEGLISSLQSATEKVNWQPPNTEWGNYYDDTNYVDEAMKHKEALVQDFVRSSGSAGKMAADFGANTGRFSRIAANEGFEVLSYDVDEVAVERNYRQVRETGETMLHPLLLDLTNPSPGVGWSNEERGPVIGRADINLGMALALIHHIAISNNVPLQRCAALFAKLCERLVIEFVPKSDSQVKRLLATREDIFPDYTEAGFRAAFEEYFTIEKAEPIPDTERHLYLMVRR